MALDCSACVKYKSSLSSKREDLVPEENFIVACRIHAARNTDSTMGWLTCAKTHISASFAMYQLAKHGIIQTDQNESDPLTIQDLRWYIAGAVEHLDSIDAFKHYLDKLIETIAKMIQDMKKTRVKSVDRLLAALDESGLRAIINSIGPQQRKGKKADMFTEAQSALNKILTKVLNLAAQVGDVFTTNLIADKVLSTYRALVIATTFGHFEIVKWIKPYCTLTTTNYKTLLHAAIREGHENIANYYLQNKANFVAQVTITSAEWHQYAYSAIQRGHQHIIDKILVHEVPKNTLDTMAIYVAKGAYNLLYACIMAAGDGNIEHVRTLVPHCGPETVNAALVAAARIANREIINILTAAGASDWKGAAYAAIKSGDHNLVDECIERAPQMYKHEWNRAMRIAASVGDVMLIGLFMAYGADDIVGAIAVGNDSLFEHFASVDPDIKNTALIKFARTGQLENVHRCMRQGAVNISEAIAAAESSGHNNVAEFLRSYMA